MTRPPVFPGSPACVVPPAARSASPSRPPATALATALCWSPDSWTGGLTLAPRRQQPARRPRSPRSAEPRHPGRLHRLRLRPVPRPRPARDEQVADVLAVPGGRHLHLRQLPRVPRPAEPDARLGQHPARQGLAAAADHPRPAGLVPAALPAVPGRPQDQPERGTDDRTRGPRARARPRPTRPSPTPRRWASSPGSTLWYDLEGFDDGLTDCRESALAFLSTGPTSCTRSATSPASTPAPARASRCSTTRASSRPGQFSLPDADLDRPLGRPGEHLHVVHPRGRLAAGRPDEAVPGRPRRDLGRRPHQHRPQLPRPRPRLGAPPARRTARGTRISYWRYPAVNPGDASKVVPALQCLLKEKGAYDGPISGTYDDATVAAAQAWMSATGPRRAAEVRPADWVSLLSEGPSRC